MQEVQTAWPAREAAIAPLSIVIPHVELDLTAIALREAARLGSGLETRVTVLAIRTVPYPASLDPASHPDYFRDLIALAESSELPVTVNVVFAREWAPALEQMVERSAVVLMAYRRKLLLTRQEKMARWLTRAGYAVTMLLV
jgi:hypothetical protein